MTFRNCPPGTHRKVWGGIWASPDGRLVWWKNSTEAPPTPSRQDNHPWVAAQSHSALWRTLMLRDDLVKQLILLQHGRNISKKTIFWLPFFWIHFCTERGKKPQCVITTHNEITRRAEMANKAVHMTCARSRKLPSRFHTLSFPHSRNLFFRIVLSKMSKIGWKLKQCFTSYCHTLLLITVQNSDVDFHQGSVLPQRRRFCDIQAHSCCDRFQEVVTTTVAQVSGAYLSAHVPAIKGYCSEFQSSTIQHHVRYSRQSVPTQAHFLKPIIPEGAVEDVFLILFFCSLKFLFFPWFVNFPVLIFCAWESCTKYVLTLGASMWLQEPGLVEVRTALDLLRSPAAPEAAHQTCLLFPSIPLTDTTALKTVNGNPDQTQAANSALV